MRLMGSHMEMVDDKQEEEEEAKKAEPQKPRTRNVESSQVQRWMADPTIRVSCPEPISPTCALPLAPTLTMAVLCDVSVSTGRAE